MSFKNIIWDFDGTLFDTYPTMVKHFRKTFLKFGKKISGKDALSLLKDSFNVALSHYCKEFKLDETKVVEAYMEIKELERKENYSPFRGIKTLCKDLIESGKSNYIFTHRDDTTYIYLEKQKLSDLFVDVVDVRHISFKKPDPEGINFLIEKHNMNREETIYIGDRKLDVDAAHKAEIKACLFTPTKPSIITNADFIAKSVKELRKILLD